jgi:hypothetical protein
VISAAGGIESAPRGNRVARWETGRLSAVLLGLGGKQALSLKLEASLAGGPLGKRDLRAAYRRFLTLSHLCGAMVGGKKDRLASVSCLRSNDWEQIHIHKVKITRFNLALLVVVRPLEDWPAPLSHKALGDALDAGLRSLAFGIEEDDFAYPTAEEYVFVDWQFRERIENVSLDVVRWEAPVIKGLKQVFDGLKEVCLRVENSILDGGPVEERCDLGKELELVCRSHMLVAGFVICHTGLLNCHLEIRDLVIECFLEVLKVVS